MRGATSAPRDAARCSAAALATLLLWGCLRAGPGGAAGAPGDGSADPGAALSAGDALPDAPPFPADLLKLLDEKRRERGPGYIPRTTHLKPDGGARWTNRLFLSASPYLLQHAHNPVNWYPWGEEAFAAARELNRPILLSVGYSTCHWCHVMEEESFEDQEIAAVLNRSYIAIKVDREERPDIDAIYMTAVQTMTGRGGWPMTVWLTPVGEPFHGGTYFPARDGERGVAVGFLTLLRDLRKTFDEQPDEVAQTAGRMAWIVRQRLEPAAGGDRAPGAEVLRSAAEFYRPRYDIVHGGLRGAPKFPGSLPIRFLLRYHRRSGDILARRMAVLTLEKMAAGGMCDQVGGGFHRYSTDPQWLAPHFEKMLYQNALLAVAYLEGWQATGVEAFARVARDILRYIERDMTSPAGAFYSATDADSPTPSGRREEGYFFTWTPAEIARALGAERARIVSAYYRVTDGGDLEGRDILNVPRPPGEVARELALTPAALMQTIDAAREDLYRARAGRPAPLRDEKILTAWNGLAISAHARAAMALGDRRYAQSAARAADFVLRNLMPDGRLMRSYSEGRAHHAAYLDDYAFLGAGLLDLFEATGEARWLEAAIALDAALAADYEDTEAGGFYLTASGQEELLARQKPAYDGEEPSGNSVAVMNLLRLHELTTDDRYRARAERALAALGPVLGGSPAALSEMLLAIDFRTDSPKQIVIVTPGPASEAGPLLVRLGAAFVPNRVLTVVTAGPGQEAVAKLVPLVRDKTPRDGRATAYVCERRVCDLPTTDPQVFARQIGKVERLTPAPSN